MCCVKCWLWQAAPKGWGWEGDRVGLGILSPPLFSQLICGLAKRSIYLVGMRGANFAACGRVVQLTGHWQHSDDQVALLQLLLYDVLWHGMGEKHATFSPSLPPPSSRGHSPGHCVSLAFRYKPASVPIISASLSHRLAHPAKKSNLRANGMTRVRAAPSAFLHHCSTVSW